MRLKFSLVMLIGTVLLAGCANMNGPTNTPAAKRYSIADYGAVGDATTVNTKAIQALIDKVASDGGGTVVVPAGTFVTGSIFFKQGVNLHLEKDGVIKGTTNMADYPAVDTRWEGIERQWTAALVNFFDMKNVTLDGPGLIDGSGDAWFGGGRGFGRGATTGPATQPGARIGRGFGRGGPGTQPAATQPFARGRGAATQPGGGLGRGRPRLIAFQNCRDVLVSAINMKNQSSWGLFMVYSENVTVQDITVRVTTRIPSSDGIDIDSSRHVKVMRCDIQCYDDNIAIKCGKDDDGRRVNRPSEYITISDCVFGTGEGVAIGSEVTGSIRHVVVERCKLFGSHAGVRFKSQPTRGGVLEDITYRDIELNNVNRAYEFLMFWNSSPREVPNELTKVRNIKISNVSGTAGMAGIISGLEGMPIDGITFENCNVTASQGLRITNAKNIDTRGLTMRLPEGVQPLVLQNATTMPAQ